MAGGRGEFFRSLREGLERKRAPGGRHTGPSGTGRGPSGPGPPGPGPPNRAAGSVGGNRRSFPEARTEMKKMRFPKTTTSSPQENWIERLPPEVLTRILSFLDAASLLSVSHVSKLFHQVANDDVVWQKMYVSEFGSQTWRPRPAEEAALKEAEDRLECGWKKLFFRTMFGQDVSMWRRELRHLSPFTGLPKQTEWVLRNLNVSWELTLGDYNGCENTLQPSQVYFFQSSVIVRWSGNGALKYHHISSIQLHGVREGPAKSPHNRKPGWRSLMVRLDMKTQTGWVIGKDRLISLMLVSPGFIIGVWRGNDTVAFVLASLHFHRLVEKSLLGSLVCPYSEPIDLPLAGNSDPEFGLHGYTLHFVLHTTGTGIMSVCFHQLSLRTVLIRRGLMELRVVNRTNLAEHRPLSGRLALSWTSESLEGAVENCCLITLTLLDEFQKPFWCVSSASCVRPARSPPSRYYSGEHFVMEHRSEEGKVEMKLVWLEEQKQFFLISLVLFVPVHRVNQRFSTEY